MKVPWRLQAQLMSSCTFWRKRNGAFFVAGLLVALYVSQAATFPDWEALSPGLELTYLTASGAAAPAQPRIAVLRVDPRMWELEVMGTSRTNESGGHTAREWCERHKFTAA